MANIMLARAETAVTRILNAIATTADLADNSVDTLNALVQTGQAHAHSYRDRNFALTLVAAE